MAKDKTANRIEFRYAPSLPMGARWMWIGGLIVVGFAIQMVFSVILGWLFILAGCCLGIIKSRSTEPDIFPTSGEWQTTTIEELQSIEKLSSRIQQWRGSLGSFHAAGTGCGWLVSVALALFLSTFVIAVTMDGEKSAVLGPPLRGGLLYPIWILDSVTMLIPIWFAGRFKAWEPPDISTKAGYLLYIYRAFGSRPQLEFLPSLYVSGLDDRMVPRDCRLLVKLKDAPADFIGIQVQISMNAVQGTKYPYCYAVIIAKKAFGLAKKAGPLLEPAKGVGILASLFKDSNERKEAGFPQFDDSITEVESESDVDVVVIRQITTGQGYHTTQEEAGEVFSDALALAVRIVRAKHSQAA